MGVDGPDPVPESSCEERGEARVRVEVLGGLVEVDPEEAGVREEDGRTEERRQPELGRPTEEARQTPQWNATVAGDLQTERYIYIYKPFINIYY